MFILPSFSKFLFFHLSLLCNVYGDLLLKISQQLLDLGIIKFGTKVGYDKLCCVTKNQPHIAYQSLYLSIFLSFK